MARVNNTTMVAQINKMGGGRQIEGPPISYKPTVRILAIPSNCADSRIFGRRIEHNYSGPTISIFQGPKQVVSAQTSIKEIWGPLSGPIYVAGIKICQLAPRPSCYGLVRYARIQLLTILLNKLMLGQGSTRKTQLCNGSTVVAYSSMVNIYTGIIDRFPNNTATITKHLEIPTRNKAPHTCIA